jgi:RNA methyltransferase, TrmH family
MLSKNQIKEIQSLQLKKFRDSRKLFIAEGIKTVCEIIDQRPEALKEIFATRDFIESHSEKISALRVTEASETELKKISLQNTPNHVLSVCHYFDETAPVFDFKNNFSLYLDDVRDPGNLGTIIRLAGWFGLSTIFCSPASCDFYNPKVIQSTMGAFLRVNVVYTGLPELLAQIPGVPVYGAVLNGKSLYAEKPGNGLIIIGNEANGISEANLKLVSNPITIPASGQNNTESLNAAIATSIIVSEFFRQLKL